MTRAIGRCPESGGACFRKVSEGFQLLGDLLLEHSDLSAVLHYRANSLVSQARHLFDLLPVPVLQLQKKREFDGFRR
jgi:hypothetical protein